jgi:P27 family predicted phage terminase small subunit
MAAQDTWSATIQEMMTAGTLTRANGPAIRRLVDFTIIYARAARHVAESGPVLKAKRAKTGQWNPYFSAMNKASAEIRALEADLGLTPTTRGKSAKVHSRAPRPWVASDEFISPSR